MADELRAVYLLTGTDRPKITRALRRLRTHFGDEGVEVLGADAVSWEDVATSLNSLGLFGAGRLVIVQGVEQWKKADVEALGGYLSAPVAGNVLALACAEAPKEDAVANRAVRFGGEVVGFDIPKPKEPSVWARSDPARLGAQATDDA